MSDNISYQIKRMYLFLDEVQRVPDWEDAVNSFRVDFNCDIYVTGSNAYMLPLNMPLIYPADV
ncbi:MAG: AAA family ATPase [Roseburia intestinalis]